MNDINDVLRRASILSAKTQRNSITPKEVGGLFNDIAELIKSLKAGDGGLTTAIVRFSGKTDADITDAGTPQSGHPENVYYSTKALAFVYKMNDGEEDIYYKIWGDDYLWNDPGTGLASDRLIFVAADNSMYMFTGLDLVGLAISGIWPTAEFNSILTGSETIVEASIPQQADPEDVFFSNEKKVFCIKSDGVYYTNWGNASAWNQPKEDTGVGVGSSLPYEARSNTYFLDKNLAQYIFNGTTLVCVSGSGSGPEPIPDEYYRTRRFAGIISGNINIEQTGKVAEAVPSDVYYSGRLNMFVFREQVEGEDGFLTTKYYAVWSNSSLWNNMTVPVENVYFIDDSTGYQYLFNGAILRPTGTGGSITIDDELSDTSENAVQNKVITDALTDMFTWHDTGQAQTNATPAEKIFKWKDNN